MINSILESPPSLGEIFATLKAAELQKKAEFVQAIKGTVWEMQSYLVYERSALSRKLRLELEDLFKGRIPARWLKVSPFAARSAKDLEDWKSQIQRWLGSEIAPFELDLSIVFAPALALNTVLRAYFLSQQVAATRKKGSLSLDKLGFAASQPATPDPAEFQVVVSGLQSQHFQSSHRERLGPLLFIPRKIPKGIRTSPAYPPGLKVLIERTKLSKGEWAISADQSAAETLLYCPLQVDSVVWVLTSGPETQGEWGMKQACIEVGM